jgi:prevent-host-death family protein
VEKYTIHKAKTHLSKLLEKVEKGEEIIISRGKNPVAILKKYEESDTPRKAGRLKGKIKIADDFNEFGEDLQGLFDINE